MDRHPAGGHLCGGPGGKEKGRYDIQSYREIVAFVEGTTLDEIEKAKEEGKRIYQKILLAVGTGVLALAVSLFFIWLLGV